MMQRSKYHFEPQRGWINDPNGLVFWKGQYHAFFQHNPEDATPNGKMHWGHAVSEDLINWEELPIAIFPNCSYDSNGCWSGSAVVKDDILYLFYTSLREGDSKQTQSLVISYDGINFSKYENNPIISDFPIDGSNDFRDPKVTLIRDTYYMVIGSGKDGVGKILLYKSQNLFNWEYVGVLFSGEEFGNVLECPDFSKYGDKYLLIFSQMNKKTATTAFLYGDFDGEQFVPQIIAYPEFGPYFYSPQTFIDNKNRHLLIGWLSRWDKPISKDAVYNGMLSLPREIKIKDGKIFSVPVEEALHLLKTDDHAVNIKNNTILIDVPWEQPLKYVCDEITDIKILRDTKTIEVFINNGEVVFSCYLEV